MYTECIKIIVTVEVILQLYVSIADVCLKKKRSSAVLIIFWSVSHFYIFALICFFFICVLICALICVLKFVLTFVVILVVIFDLIVVLIIVLILSY